MSKFTNLGNNKKDENTSHQEHIEGGMPQTYQTKKSKKKAEIFPYLMTDKYNW